MRIRLAAFILLCACSGSSDSKVVAVPSRDQVTRKVPTPDWWKKKEPCPEGTILVGAGPPKNKTARCQIPTGGVNHGPATEWYLRGGIRSTGHFHFGAPDGVWEVRWESGEIRRRTVYDAGRVLTNDFYCENGSQDRPSFDITSCGPRFANSCELVLAEVSSCHQLRFSDRQTYLRRTRALEAGGNGDTACAKLRSELPKACVSALK